jgi:hypothetical protein
VKFCSNRAIGNFTIYKGSVPNLKALTFVSALIFPAYISNDPLRAREMVNDVRGSYIGTDRP